MSYGLTGYFNLDYFRKLSCGDCACPLVTMLESYGTYPYQVSLKESDRFSGLMLKP